MSYHSYADDTQIYQVIKPQGDWSDLSESLALILLGSTLVSYMHQLKLAIEFDQCYESAENKPLGRKTVCFYIFQTMSERKATVRGVLTKPRLHSGTVYLCHCGM
jgi:hypothetical protein